MYPEQPSPYWNDIVGSNWPEIEPSTWRSLATIARAGADAIDSDTVHQAISDLGSTVRESQALTPLVDHMRRLAVAPIAFQETLLKAAGTLESIAATTERTRNQILDIVDRTTSEAEKTSKHDAGEEDDDDDERVGPLLARAHAEVDDVISAAIESFGPAGIFDLSQLDSLTSTTPRNFGDSHPQGTGPLPVADSTLHRLSDPFQPHRSTETRPLPRQDELDAESNHHDSNQIGLSDLPLSTEFSSSPDSSARSGPAATSTTAADDAAADRETSTTPGTTATATPLSPTQDLIFADQTGNSASTMAIGALTATGLAAALGLALLAVSASGSPQAQAEVRSSSLPPKSGNRQVFRSAQQTTATSTNSPMSPSTPGTPGRQPAKAATVATPSSDESRPGSVHQAIAAALIATATPTYIVGDRPEGDIHLARAILASACAAAPLIPGLSWAVAILRRAHGVNAFITTDEGQGWIPAGVFLPSEVSTPWVWSDVTFEGTEGTLADPAQALADFAARWGPRHESRLSALASTRTIPAGFRQSLGADVDFAQSVAPDPVLDFTQPGPGLSDRLTMIGNPAHLDATPPDRLRARSINLAWKANQDNNSHHQDRSDRVKAMRRTVLVRLRRNDPVPDTHWTSLRESYDALAAELHRFRPSIDGTPLERGSRRGAAGSGDSRRIRYLLDERRRTELVLLLENEVNDLQQLRDLTYARHHLFNPAYSAEPVASTRSH